MLQNAIVEGIKVFRMGIFKPGYVIGLGVNICSVLPVLYFLF